jgi:hypothetical protein
MYEVLQPFISSRFLDYSKLLLCDQTSKLMKFLNYVLNTFSNFNKSVAFSIEEKSQNPFQYVLTITNDLDLRTIHDFDVFCYLISLSVTKYRDEYLKSSIASKFFCVNPLVPMGKDTLVIRNSAAR